VSLEPVAANIEIMQTASVREYTYLHLPTDGVVLSTKNDTTEL